MKYLRPAISWSPTMSSFRIASTTWKKEEPWEGGGG